MTHMAQLLLVDHLICSSVHRKAITDWMTVIQEDLLSAKLLLY